MIYTKTGLYAHKEKNDTQRQYDHIHIMKMHT